MLALFHYTSFLYFQNDNKHWGWLITETHYNYHEEMNMQQKKQTNRKECVWKKPPNFPHYGFIILHLKMSHSVFDTFLSYYLLRLPW